MGACPIVRQGGTIELSPSEFEPLEAAASTVLAERYFMPGVMGAQGLRAIASIQTKRGGSLARALTALAGSVGGHNAARERASRAKVQAPPTPGSRKSVPDSRPTFSWGTVAAFEADFTGFRKWNRSFDTPSMSEWLESGGESRAYAYMQDRHAERVDRAISSFARRLADHHGYSPTVVRELVGELTSR